MRVGPSLSISLRVNKQDRRPSKHMNTLVRGRGYSLTFFAFVAEIKMQVTKHYSAAWRGQTSPMLMTTLQRTGQEIRLTDVIWWSTVSVNAGMLNIILNVIVHSVKS